MLMNKDLYEYISASFIYELSKNVCLLLDDFLLQFAVK